MTSPKNNGSQFLQLDVHLMDYFSLPNSEEISFKGPDDGEQMIDNLMPSFKFCSPNAYTDHAYNGNLNTVLVENIPGANLEQETELFLGANRPATGTCKRKRSKSTEDALLKKRIKCAYQDSHLEFPMPEPLYNGHGSDLRKPLDINMPMVNQLSPDIEQALDDVCNAHNIIPSREEDHLSNGIHLDSLCRPQSANVNEIEVTMPHLQNANNFHLPTTQSANLLVSAAPPLNNMDVAMASLQNTNFPASAPLQNDNFPKSAPQSPAKFQVSTPLLNDNSCQATPAAVSEINVRIPQLPNENFDKPVKQKFNIISAPRRERRKRNYKLSATQNVQNNITTSPTTNFNITMPQNFSTVDTTTLSVPDTNFQVSLPSNINISPFTSGNFAVVPTNNDIPKTSLNGLSFHNFDGLQPSKDLNNPALHLDQYKFLKTVQAPHTEVRNHVNFNSVANTQNVVTYDPVMATDNGRFSSSTSLNNLSNIKVIPVPTKVTAGTAGAVSSSDIGKEVDLNHPLLEIDYVNRKQNVWQIHACRKCNFKSKWKKNYEQHIKNEHPPKASVDKSFKKTKTGFVCQLCYFFFSDESDIRCHFIEVHLKSNLNQSRSQGPVGNLQPKARVMNATKSVASKDEVFECSKCKMEFYTTQKLLQHHLSHKDITKCAACHEQLACHAKWEEHIRINHLNTYPFGCYMCDKSFKLERYLRAHMKTHGLQDMEAKNMCLFCNRRFDSKEILIKHTESHRVEINGVTQFQKEENRSENSDPMDNHIIPNRHICNICDNGEKTKLKLALHLEKCLNVSSKNEKNSCFICGISFSVRKNFLSHLFYHNKYDMLPSEDGASFNCPKCQLKSFPNKLLLSKHSLSCRGKKLDNAGFTSYDPIVISDSDSELIS